MKPLFVVVCVYDIYIAKDPLYIQGIDNSQQTKWKIHLSLDKHSLKEVFLVEIQSSVMSARIRN